MGFFSYTSYCMIIKRFQDIIAEILQNIKKKDKKLQFEKSKKAFYICKNKHSNFQ